MTMPGFVAEAALQANMGRYPGFPADASTEVGQAVTPQWSWLPGLGALKCAACCKGKAGYVACVARCLVDGKCCDSGQGNCS